MQVLRRTCFMFYCLFYFTCDRSILKTKIIRKLFYLSLSLNRAADLRVDYDYNQPNNKRHLRSCETKSRNLTCKCEKSGDWRRVSDFRRSRNKLIDTPPLITSLIPGHTSDDVVHTSVPPCEAHRHTCLADSCCLHVSRFLCHHVVLQAVLGDDRTWRRTVYGTDDSWSSRWWSWADSWQRWTCSRIEPPPHSSQD